MRLLPKLSIAATALLCAACAQPAPDLPSDAEGASFGGGAKADDLFSVCEKSEVLKLLNESTSTPDHLVELGINRRAAESVWAHRLGADAQLGTADDDIFDDFNEFDDVAWVGPATLGQAVDAIASRCHEDLRNRPYIDRTTFASSTGGGWTRDNEELESAMMVHGITGARLGAILRDTDSRGRTVFSRLRRDRDLEGLSYGYAIDEVPWSDGTLQAREALGYVSLSIESGRFEVDPEDQRRELSLGTDIMDDIYYDTANFDLLGADLMIRGRVRWDTNDTVRRLLIAAKFESTVDATGLKRAAKVDVRTEGGTHAATLNDDVMRGTVSWSGRPAPVEPIQAVYERLVELGVTEDMQGRADVLLLHPKLYMRSERSRYHLNEAALDALQRYYVNGRTRIEDANALITQRLADLPAASHAQAETLLALGQRILSGDEIASRVGSAVSTARPDEFVAPTSVAELERQHAVADAVYEAMHEYAALLDDLDNVLAGTDGVAIDDAYAEMFVAWRKSVDTSLVPKSIARPFLDDHTDLSADVASAVADFNAFGEAQRAANNDVFEDFEPIDAAGFAELRAWLLDEDLGNSHRMIATAGIMARSIWFDFAREFYVPASNRASYSNFIIDTTDFTQMLSHEEWTAIPEADRKPGTPLDPARVFHSVLVNEVQIELGSEVPYLERIEALTQELANNPQPETEAMLAGARFVFDEYRKALTTIGELKGDDILDRLEDEGGPADMTWGPSIAAKGTMGMVVIADGVRGPNP